MTVKIHKITDNHTHTKIFNKAMLMKDMKYFQLDQNELVWIETFII